MSSKMQVELLGSYGSDYMIAKQAWVSTGVRPTGAFSNLQDIKQLIDTLVSRKHTKPLEIVDFHLKCTWPIFVDRQQQTHRMQRASIAQSGRYGATTLEMYEPPELSVIELEDAVLHNAIMQAAVQCYQDMTAKYTDKFGKTRTREIFRGILPQNQMITRTFKIDLWNLANFLRLRRARSAQLEMRQVADLILEKCRSVCPLTFAALERNFLI